MIFKDVKAEMQRGYSGKLILKKAESLKEGIMRNGYDVNSAED